jgi:hypothetical protein
MYNYIINAQYNYYISHKVLEEECDKEENVAVTGAAAVSCLERICKSFCPMSHIRPVTPQTGAPTIYPVNTSHRSDLCKNVSLQCYLVATVIHIQSVRSQICVCIHIHIHMFFTIWRRWSGKRNKRIGTTVNAACQRNLSVCHRLASPALYGSPYVYRIPNCAGPSG